MKEQETVARNLRKLRVREKLSQEALAVDAGIDRTYVSRLERGLENPTVSVLSRLAKAMNAKIDDFFVPVAPNEPRPSPLPSGRRPKRK